VRIVLYAVSSPHAAELLETANRLGWEIAAAVRNVADAPVPPELNGVIDADLLDPRLLELEFAVPQTNPANRYLAVRDARARGFRRAAVMIDPTAIVAASACLGPGCYVGAGSVIGAGARLADGCLINRSCSLAHHVVFDRYASTGPGAVIAGSCRIGTGAFVGAGAVLAPEVEVGAGAFVGAGSVVIRHVDPGEVVVGNPARVLKQAVVPAEVPWAGLTGVGGPRPDSPPSAL
jgi:sugar O-acyltransferase (sialic acid O-acetyltransferase NeuD family)